MNLSLHRHLVMRAAIEAYMETEKRELAIQNVREAVDRVAPVLNALSFNKGYTPAQWALNTNPRDPTTILGDDIWGHLGPSWGHLGPSWAILWPSWAILGPSWGHLGAILGPSWGHLWGHPGPSHPSPTHPPTHPPKQ